MDIEIKNDRNNAVMNRREVEFFIIQDDKTPSKEDVKREICKKLNLNPEFTVVVSIGQTFGTRQSVALAHSYPNAETMKRQERGYLFERVEAKARKAAKRAAAGGAEAQKEGQANAKAEGK